MTSHQLTISSDRWSLLEAPPLASPPEGHDLLHANGRLRSLAKFAIGAGGTPYVRTEIPPHPMQAVMIDHAREEMSGVHTALEKSTAPTLADPTPEFFEEAIAMAREGGWDPEIRTGGETTISLGRARGARLGRINGNKSAYVETLTRLPGDPVCRVAAAAYALAVSSSIRLVRAVLLEGDRLLWQVPLPAGIDSEFLGHALNALATAQHAAGPPLEAIAASPNLASAWMHEHNQT